MEEKKPNSKDIIIDGEVYPLYDVTINDKQMFVASPTLYNKIDECIMNGRYYENICEMDGKTFSVSDVDDTFEYFYGDFEKTMDPSEKDVIESIMDAIAGEEQAEFERAFEKAVLNGKSNICIGKSRLVKFIV